ncbi:hypothetical protein BD779DRAFT_1584834, partial [Infundibulicybe gibba]
MKQPKQGLSVFVEHIVLPVEVEPCLLDHPDVPNTRVVEIPDEYRGEIPMAFVTLTGA